MTTFSLKAETFGKMSEGCDLCKYVYQAAKQGHSDCLKRIPETKQEVNCVDPVSGHTPLIAAILTDQKLPFIKVLVDYGADVNQKAKKPNSKELLSPDHLAKAKSLKRQSSNDFNINVQGSLDGGN